MSRVQHAVGTHEYMDLMEQLGARSYVSANVGSGSSRAMGQWIEYMTAPGNSALAQERRRNGREKPFTLDYLGIDNESWGCGGLMKPAHYADLLRAFVAFVRPGGGQRVAKVASGADREDYAWTETAMSNARVPSAGPRPIIDAISLNYYTFVGGSFWARKGPATGFGEAEWMAVMSQAMRLDDIIAKHSAIMDKMVNVLQAMILTANAKMVLTPTYHVSDMFQDFQDATFLPLDVRAPLY